MKQTKKRIAVSVVMPSFNEERAVESMIKSIKTYTKKYKTEIVIVDSSDDRTPEIARKHGARVVIQPPLGHGIALRKAIAEARHDIILTMDCDYTYPTEYIPKLIALMQEGAYDLISCNRLTKKFKKDMPFLNNLGNWIFAFLVRRLYNIKVHDVSTGMFCMNRKVNEKIDWETNYSFPCEVILKSNFAGFKYREIDIPYRRRIGEITLNRWKSGKAYLKCILNYKFNLGINPKQL